MTSIEAWARCGLMAITGRSERQPIGPPSGLMTFVANLANRFPDVDVAALLAERAAISGLSSRGNISCGGACQILPTADGFIAVSLPRPEDIDLVPAWLSGTNPSGSLPSNTTVDDELLWAAIAESVNCSETHPLLERAQLLQMAVAALGETPDRPPVVTTEVTHPNTSVDTMTMDIETAIVVDLSALWAGPLCSHLLALCGARVIKVESTHRPDGARLGPRDFFDLLNAYKECVALDIRHPAGVDDLRALLMKADIVIDSSRPRAWEHLGISPSELIAAGGPRIWASITAYGRTGHDANRVGFGDDTAVAGGLVVWDNDQPLFCGDAIADPLTGFVTAAACLDAVETGFTGLIDVALSATAKAASGPTLSVPAGIEPSPPRARRVTTHAHDVGVDTNRVLTELGIRR